MTVHSFLHGYFSFLIMISVYSNAFLPPNVVGLFARRIFSWETHCLLNIQKIFGFSVTQIRVNLVSVATETGGKMSKSRRDHKRRCLGGLLQRSSPAPCFSEWGKTFQERISTPFENFKIQDCWFDQLAVIFWISLWLPTFLPHFVPVKQRYRLLG